MFENMCAKLVLPEAPSNLGAPLAEALDTKKA